MRRVRVLCGAVVVCVAFELMGQAAPASPKLGETEPSLMMPENASFEIGADYIDDNLFTGAYKLTVKKVVAG